MLLVGRRKRGGVESLLLLCILIVDGEELADGTGGVYTWDVTSLS